MGSNDLGTSNSNFGISMPGWDGRATNSFVSKFCKKLKNPAANNNRPRNAISFGDCEYGARRRMTYNVPKNMDVPVVISKPNVTDVASPDVTIGPAISISIADAIMAGMNTLA